ncbi:MAG: hypothetical protein OSB47_07800, partial [Pirellulaceae bacterium]|nr:hypothetical protein [Pirellulaceae bacterium]
WLQVSINCPVTSWKSCRSTGLIVIYEWLVEKLWLGETRIPISIEHLEEKPYNTFSVLAAVGKLAAL